MLEPVNTDQNQQLVLGSPLEPFDWLKDAVKTTEPQTFLTNTSL